MTSSPGPIQARILGAAVVAVCTMVACTDTTAPAGTVGSVVLAPATPTLVVGDTFRLVAGILDPDGTQLTDRKVVWRSADPDIATVSSGLVTAIGGGTVTITASAEGAFDSTSVRVVPSLHAVQVEVGNDFTCAVDAGGGAYCWGYNYDGQLGIGLDDGSVLRPTPIAGGLQWRAVQVGGWNACGLTELGAPYCWGLNYNGQLGDSSLGDQWRVPAPLPALEVPTGLAVGSRSICALEASRVECWGLLAGATTPAFSSLSAGGYMACGLTAAGAAYCWGSNRAGGLGDGTNQDRPSPTPVVGGHLFTSIDVADGGCGVDATGGAWCWGGNGYGRLGDGTTVDRNTPTAVAGGIAFRRISMGGSLSCGISLNDVTYCWGYNWSGQLGNGSTASVLMPTPVAGGHRFTAVSAGSQHTCALDDAGVVFCWGNNESGQLGDNSRVNRTVPTKVWGPQDLP